MKTILVFLGSMIAYSSLLAQNIEQISDSLMSEGKRLYKSEMASWYGTDVFLEKYKDRANVGGYFSYSAESINKCVFFSKSDAPKVIGTISFDSTYSVTTAQIDLSERNFSETEKELYTIRTVALKEVNNDTLFLSYKNTSLNLIPLISNGQKKVYVLTGPQENGVVIFGNDYLLNFNRNNELISKRQLHKSIISVNYSAAETTAVGAMHTHLPETGDFITATDICTLMLYEKFAKWQQHYVISEKYVSIWDCSKNLLAILSRQAWENIYNNSEHKSKHN